MDKFWRVSSSGSGSRPILRKANISENGDEVVGLYVLISSINSSFPLSPSYVQENDMEDVR